MLLEGMRKEAFGYWNIDSIENGSIGLMMNGNKMMKL